MLTSLALVVAGVLVWTAVRDEPYVVVPPASERAVVRPAAAAAVLEDLERAVDAGDAAAADALAPGGDDAAARHLADLVANARDLRVTAFSLRYVDHVGAVSAEGDWRALTEVTWRLAGWDDRTSRAEIQVGLRTSGERVAITSTAGGDLRSPVWLTGRVRVRRTAETLVVDRAGSAGRVSRLAMTAVPVVRRVLPGWRGRLVVEVPASPAGLDDALAAERGRYSAVAAVTASADGSSGARAPVHVFVNPAVLDDLGAVGAQVVMSHEATHVAVGAADSDLPLWLVEGFADYVALRDVNLPARTTAAQIITQVRRDGVPRDLPGPDEFDTTSGRLGAAYESAWLACEVLADAGGEAALVALYRAQEQGRATDAALRTLFGFGERELVRRWRSRLSDLAA